MPWVQTSLISGHGMEADFNCSGLDYVARFAVTGDFDGDGRDEIAVAPENPGTPGNDFWVMKFNNDPNNPGWFHLSPSLGSGVISSSRNRCRVCINPRLRVVAHTPPLSSN